ncbi:MAG: hypothetical protein ACJA0S_001120 [Rickettsiales bacterium]|jgi:hypothetical protein
MKRFLILTFLILGFGSILEANALNRNIENKSLCEKTKGVWRAFNNNCADVCDSKFEYLVCTSIPIMTCDCGSGKCWDGGKCISEKLAKSIWDEKNEPLIEARKQEIKDLEERRIAVGLPAKPPIFDPEIHTQEIKDDPVKIKVGSSNYKPPQIKLPQNSSVISSTIRGFLKTPSNKIPKDPPSVKFSSNESINQESENQEEESDERKICQSQNGNWQGFKNGCADNCRSQVSENAVCSQSSIKACECGGSKCWDSPSKSCVDLEDYKLSVQAKNNNGKIKNGIDNAAKVFDSIPFPEFPTF